MRHVQSRQVMKIRPLASARFPVPRWRTKGTSTPVPFYIHSENCSVETATTVTTTFSGADSSVDGAVLGVTGNATDVGIVMTDGDSNTITG